MSDEEILDETTPIQLGKRTLDAIIEGVAAKLLDHPPPRQADKPGEPSDASGSNNGRGE